MYIYIERERKFVSWPLPAHRRTPVPWRARPAHRRTAASCARPRSKQERGYPQTSLKSKRAVDTHLHVVPMGMCRCLAQVQVKALIEEG